MTRYLFGLLAAAVLSLTPVGVNAQECENCKKCGRGYKGDCIGRNAIVPNGLCHQYNHVGRVHARQAQRRPWHAGYYHQQYGAPVALVVPPTADSQLHYGWGVGSTRITPIYHQFTRPYPGHGNGAGGVGGTGFAPKPTWPSDTTQYGVYYIRGPW